MGTYILGGVLVASAEVGTTAWASFWLVKILGHIINLTGQPTVAENDAARCCRQCHRLLPTASIADQPPTFLATLFSLALTPRASLWVQGARVPLSALSTTSTWTYSR